MSFSELTPALQKMNNSNDKHDNSHISWLRCALTTFFSSYQLKKSLVASVTFRTAKTLGHRLGTRSVFCRTVNLVDGPDLLRRL